MRVRAGAESQAASGAVRIVTRGSRARGRPAGRSGAPRSETVIQRFGSALNLNLHFHMLFLDGVYVERGDGRIRFRWVKAPLSVELSVIGAVREGDVVFTGIGQHMEFMAGGAASPSVPIRLPLSGKATNRIRTNTFPTSNGSRK